MRAPRTEATKHSQRGGHRRVPLFLFDSHYVLAQQYVQELDVQGQCKVVVLEALKCPSPDLNNGEDNSAFKSVLGTLPACPGRGHCNNPLMCRGQVFECRYPTSDDEAAVFTCRHQWKARRADIEVLACRAEDKTDRAKRIPVLADVTLLRSHRESAATMSGHKKNTLSWSDWLVYTQLWMRIGQTRYPPWAPRILEYLGCAASSCATDLILRNRPCRICCFPPPGCHLQFRSAVSRSRCETYTSDSKAQS